MLTDNVINLSKYTSHKPIEGTLTNNMEIALKELHSLIFDNYDIIVHAYKKHLRRVKNRDKLYNKIKKKGRKL